MSFHTHAICDRCEQPLVVDNEDELLAHGWLEVRHGSEDGEWDFCSPLCLARWAADVKLPEPLTVEEITEAEED